MVWGSRQNNKELLCNVGIICEGAGMLKVLIADDEQLIRSMIRKMIDWEAKGLEIAGTADNGIDVLRLAEEEKPDIIITDIRMPGIDGLEMIRQVMASGIGSEFIIISGYKNFEYAHQALTMGVRHYLLKPIDRTELSATLDRIIAEKARTVQVREEQENLREQKESYRNSLRLHFLNSILQGTGPDIGQNDSPGEELEFGNNRYRAFLVKADWTGEGSIAPGLLEILQIIVEREEKGWDCEFVSTQLKSGILSVINYASDGTRTFKNDMETLYTKCRKEIDKFSGYSVTIGVGTEKDSISQVPGSIDEAVLSVKCRVRKGIGRIIDYSSLRYQRPDVEEMISVYRKGLKMATESLDAEAVKGDFQMGSEILRTEPRNSPEALFDLTASYTRLITEVWKDNDVDEQIIRDFSEESENLMDRSTNESQMIQRFEDLLDHFFRLILMKRMQSGQAPVREAKAYLAAHFRENPTLEEVSAAVGISPTYFSTLFKKEVGIGFSEYITQLRCEEAKRLMRESSDSMVMIAEKVGYQDAKYFSRIFRKTVGIRPSEYRKLYQ